MILRQRVFGETSGNSPLNRGKSKKKRAKALFSWSCNSALKMEKTFCVFREAQKLAAKNNISP